MTGVIVIDVKVTVENIEDKTYVCNNDGCSQPFNSEKSLKKHLCHHFDIPINKDPGSKVLYRFNCPISTCRRSLKMEKEYFTTRKHLHQHYFKVHNTGKFICSNTSCDKKFSTELLRNLHLKNCGKTFSCHCGGSFNSNEALLTHQKRKHPTISRHRMDKVSLTENTNSEYLKVKKSENPPAKKKTVSTTTSGLGLWKSTEYLSLPPCTTSTISVFTSTDQLISSTSFESKPTATPKLIKNSSTSTAEDFVEKEENSNSLSSSSSQTKKAINWNSLTAVDFDDSINLFDSDVKMEFYSAETQTDFTENLFNNNYTQTTFTDFSDFEKFDIQTQTNWDE